MAQTTSNDGFQLLSQGDFRSARDIFSSLVANRQDLAQANYGLGVIALMEHNPSLARHHFGDCLNYDPQHSNALFQLGFIEKQAGNDQGATQFWQRCLQANPRHVGALKALGLPEPQANLPLPATTPPQTFSGTSTSPGDAIGGYDLYGLLKRCNSPIELEIVRLLDEIQAMIVSKRQRISAFVGPFLLFWIVTFGVTAFLASQRGGEPIAMVVLMLAVVVTIGRVLAITCNKIECERYVFYSDERYIRDALKKRSPLAHVSGLGVGEAIVIQSLYKRREPLPRTLQI
jgi:hypothetical protein